MEFKKLRKGNTKEIELEILKEWKEKDILNKTIDNRKDNENFVFYDGPATANGKPGIHHMLAKELTDTFCKYKTMQGYKVLRKVGWDTHGLPVEVQVEKQLGFSGKKDIENYGIEEFNKKCRESVWENEEAFRKLTEEMGQFIDIKNPYITYDNDYIETEWWILKTYFDAGLIYNGYKITPYCPRCGTSFMFLMILVGIIVGFFIPFSNPFLRSFIKILCIPIIVGLGYELIKVCGKYDNVITRIISAPGLWIQRITTKEPDDDMIEIAITAMKAVIPENGDDIIGS